MKRRVVITGIGPVTSLGIGKDIFFSNILECKNNIKEIPEEYTKRYNFKSRYYVPKPDFELSQFGIKTNQNEIMGECSRISLVAAKLALEDAGYKINTINNSLNVDEIENCNIILGLGINSLQPAFESHLAHLFGKDNYIQQTLEENFRYNRMVIPILMPNSVSSWVSIIFGISGANFTINASCSSGTYAIGQAYLNILNGACETAITGGVECLHEKHGAIMRGFDMLSTLTRFSDGMPRPFSKKRSGFLFNEGAGCILILEELEHAKKRGADIYAEIIGYECNSDAYNIIQLEPTGKQIITMLNKLIKDKKIDYLNAHGTGTITNDQIEAEVIQKVFGNIENQPFINSTKGIIGHSIGASGAIEAAVTALSIKKAKIHGNITEDSIDNLNINSVTTNMQIQYALSTSYGFGGHNAAILFKRYKENE